MSASRKRSATPAPPRPPTRPVCCARERATRAGALAEATHAELRAQAEGSRAKLIADAEGKTQLAELNAYSPEAIQLLVYQAFIEQLSNVVEAAAMPLSQIDKLVLIDSAMAPTRPGAGRWVATPPSSASICNGCRATHWARPLRLTRTGARSAGRRHRRRRCQLLSRARPRVGALACAPWFPGNVTQIVHGNRGKHALVDL